VDDGTGGGAEVVVEGRPEAVEDHRLMAKKELGRRGFIASVSGGAALAQEVPPAFRPLEGVNFIPVEAPPGKLRRVWLGPEYWANRLQDWQAEGGRILCIADKAGEELRTVALLTRELKGEGAASLAAEVSGSGSAEGFAGFLIGAGAGKLDWRAAALVQRASGEGGGLLCVLGADGQLRFREHTDEKSPAAYKEVPADERWGSVAPGAAVRLRLDLGADRSLVLTAADTAGGRVTAGVKLNKIAPELRTGGVMLASNRGTYAFARIATAGEGIGVHYERKLGPILSTLFSVNERVMKLSAQLMPVGEDEPKLVELRYRVKGGSWRDARAELGPGFNAIFRITDWDSTKDHDYQVFWTGYSYEGTIPADPKDAARLTIAMVGCVSPVGRNLDAGMQPEILPGSSPIGRYTPLNMAFPFPGIAGGVAAKKPHIIQFSGDQIYEGRPTAADRGEAPTLDYLYKWYLFCWAFRELTRGTPAIVQTDDHDVYHGNIWGNGGRLAPDRDQNRGGYRNAGPWVNMVQRTQCGHNPDPFDPTPVDQGITVYYCAFRYGGVSFAVLEDRKFKTAPIQGADLDVHEPELLGARQEKFLEEWAKDTRAAAGKAEPKVCLTQTAFACIQTSPEGNPLLDWDANAHPKQKRDLAVRALRDAGAIVLAGDQHLATVVNMGLDTSTDGPVQFTGPAGASLWARWWAPAVPPAQGDWVDAFGNKIRVMAVANPSITFADYRKRRQGRGQGIEDPRLRPDGYGIVHVDKRAREFVLECWPAGTNPRHDAGKPFPGWPVRVKFPKG
jgi:alkaline phosphatase D